MKRTYFLFFFFLTCLVLPAEEIDKVIYEADYNVSLRYDANSNALHTDVFMLQIGSRGISKFFPPRYERQCILNDSIVKVGMTVDEAVQMLQGENCFQVDEKFRVFKNFPKRGILTEIDNLGGEYIAEENMPNFEWNPLSGDTIIAGLRCELAECTWRGRTWKAWYAPEIPFNEGPWKLSGLPGLIMKVSDANGDFILECIGLRNVADKPMMLSYRRTPQQCSIKELYEVRKKWLTNQMGFLTNMLGLPAPPTNQAQKKPNLMEVFK